jgi:hypothetical protein
MKIQVNPSDLTLGDIADLEEHAGVPGSALFTKLASGDWSAKMFEGMVWITVRRDNPDYTVEDAKKVLLSDIEMFSDEDPLEEAE